METIGRILSLRQIPDGVGVLVFVGREGSDSSNLRLQVVGIHICIQFV